MMLRLIPPLLLLCCCCLWILVLPPTAAEDATTAAAAETAAVAAAAAAEGGSRRGESHPDDPGERPQERLSLTPSPDLPYGPKRLGWQQAAAAFADAQAAAAAAAVPVQHTTDTQEDVKVQKAAAAAPLGDDNPEEGKRLAAAVDGDVAAAADEDRPLQALPIDKLVFFFEELPSVVHAGEPLHALLHVTGKDGALLPSFDGLLHFSFFSITHKKGDTPQIKGDTVAFQEADRSFLTGSSVVRARKGVASVEEWRFLKTGVYQIKAACDGCLSAISREVHVTSGPLFALQLVQQPAESATAGMPLNPAPVLQAVDAFNNKILDIRGEVIVQLLPGKSSPQTHAGQGDIARVMGVLQRPFKEGSVSFPRLSVGTAGEGYRLRFSLLSPSVGRPLEALSQPFNVLAAAPAALHFLLQPPPEIAAGNRFQVSVQLVDAHGNAVPDTHTIHLSARKETEGETEGEDAAAASVDFLASAAATAAKTQRDTGIAVFSELAFPPSKDLMYLKAACTSCEGTVKGHSLSTRVRVSSLITIGACDLLLEGSSDGSDSCTVSVSLEALLSSRGPRAPITIHVSHMEPISLSGAAAVDSLPLPLSVEPTVITFNPKETGVSRSLQIKALDDPHVRYSTDVSDPGSGLLLQHYRVHLRVESEDPMWGPEAVEWLDEPFIDVRVLDDDKISLRFSQLPQQPLLLRRGDSLSYEVALGFSPLGGPINVAMEAPVGVVIEPPLLTFNEENWEKAQRLQLRVTSLFPAAPMVAAKTMASGHAASKVAVSHHFQGKLGDLQIQEKEELFFWVAEEGAGKVVWTEVPGAVLAGTSVGLSFRLSLQPLEVVIITLNCGPLLQHLGSSSLILTPLQWQRGDTFRMKATDDGDMTQPSGLESCLVSMESGDRRFVSSSEETGESSVQLLVYKQHCADGTYRAHCPCLPGQHCSTARFSHCPAGTYRLPGTSGCLQCIENHFCPEGATRPEPCPEGATANAGAATCRLCTNGSECVTMREAVACPPGRYSREGVCVECPEGHFCPLKGVEEPQPCLPGTYSFPGSATCTQCPAGSFCPTAKFADMKACPSGTYSEAGSTACSPCPAGFKCFSFPGTAPLVPCNPGEYSMEGMPSCLPCPKNHACPTPLEKVPCERPTQFAPMGQQLCKPCPREFHCKEEDPKACKPGYTSLEGAGVCSKAEPLAESLLDLQIRENIGPRADPMCPEGTYNQGTGCSGYGPLGYCAKGRCFQCDKGTLCPPGASAPIPLPEGYFSVSANIMSLHQAYECPPGTYCPEGSTTVQICPTEDICMGRGTPKQRCPLGTIRGSPADQAAYDMSACITCPMGYYCPNSSQAIPCPLGTFSKTDAAISVDSCIIFPPGFMPVQTAETLVLRRRNTSHKPYTWKGKELSCPPGHISRFQTGTSTLHCEICHPRISCDSETNQYKKCPAGYYCPTGTIVGKERPCPPGTYSNVPALADAGECISCLPGYYCPKASKEQIPCPRGSYCPKRTESPDHHPCPGGTYNPNTSTIDVMQCLPCPAGKYCPQGSSAPLDCPAGTYSDGYGTKYPGPGDHPSMCKRCPSGYSCTGGVRTACGPGYTSKEGDAKCMKCPKGSYCPLQVTTYDMLSIYRCSAGMLCDEDGWADLSKSKLCPKGQYCPPGAAKGIPCPGGTYNPLEGRTGVSDCMISKAGTYAQEGTTSAAGSGVCQKGHFCPPGSSKPDQVACPAQTYNPNTGGRSANDCIPCPAGHYCGVGVVTPTPCPVGNYCPVGSSDPRVCPKGTIRDTEGAESEQDCKPCPAGHYCETPGLSQPTGECAAGTLCLERATNPAPRDGLTGVICPSFGYCEEGATQLQACPTGQFNPYEGGTSDADCRKCFPGSYCTVVKGIPVVGPCEAGYFCGEGSTSPRGTIAPAGTFAPAGSAIAHNCKPGTYTENDGSIACSPCPAGYYCDEAGMGTSNLAQKDCREGMYCEEGSIIPTNCPAGTYNRNKRGESIDDCLPCPAGKYCQTEELKDPTGNCAAGYYCAARSTSIAPLETDSFGNGPCPAGSYCPEGTPNPVPCPAGTYQPSTRASSPSDCIQCKAGWYCENKGLAQPNAQCSPGYYCEEGSTQAEPQGKKCRVGHMCPMGSTFEIPCRPGTYQDMEGSTFCNPCAGGYYCPMGADRSFDAKYICPKGSFCPRGSNHAKEYLCPPGFYNPKEGIASVLSCLPCPPGKYCGSAGLAEPSGDCAEGFYCSGGARYPNEVLNACVYESGVLGKGTGKCSSSNDPVSTKNEAENLCNMIEGCVGIEEKESSFYIRCGNVEAPDESIESIFYPKLCVEAGLCPIGYICPEGTGTPQKCPVGKYCASMGLSVASGDCQAGFFCDEGSHEPSNTANACPPGHYCPTGTKSKQQCPAGTYLPASGAWEAQQCQKCPPGQFCSLPGLSAPSGYCSAGFFCGEGSSTPVDISNVCTEGHYCPEGSAEPISCSGGTYQPQNGATSCLTCPQGSYCTVGSTTPKPCPIGFYCPPGTQHQFQYPCPQGTFGKVQGATSIEDCQLCEGGQMCNTPGTGTQGSNAMANCPAGFYCPEGAGAVIPTACSYGEYCPEKSTAPTPCPTGFYCASEALEWPTGRCRGGYVCKSRAATHSPETATSGNVCIENSQGYPCPPGYYCQSGPLVDTFAGTGSAGATGNGGPAKEATFNSLKGIAVNLARGELVIADDDVGRISTVHLSTGILTDIATLSNKAEGLAVSSDGSILYISLSNAGKIVALKLNDKSQTEVVTGLSKPSGLCLSHDGETLYVAEVGAGKISAIDLRTKNKTPAVGDGATANIVLNNPRAVAVSPEGDIFVADSNGNSRIIWVSGAKADEVEILPPLLRTIKDLELDYELGEITSLAYGKLVNPTLFLTDSTKHVVWRLDLRTNRLEQILGTGTQGFSGDGRIIPAPESKIDTPTGVAIPDQFGSPSTTLYVLDSGNKRVRKVSLSPADRGESSTEVPCPDGTFSNSEGGSTVEDCIQCPAGFACQGQGQPEVTGRCSDGYYCPEGSTKTNAVACPPGHFCKALESVFTNVALDGVVELTIPGDFVGSGTPEKVTNGETGLGTGWVSKNTSTGGHGLTVDFGDLFFINKVTLISGTARGDNILSSFSVHFFHSASSTYVELFSVSSNKESTYSFSFGEVATRKLMLSTTDSQVNLSELQVSGTSSPGPAAPTPCPKGWYQDLKGQVACKICPDGYFCIDKAAVPTQCHAGYYCPKGSYNGYENPCPVGTYNNKEGAKAVSECLPCPTGQYCGSRGLRSPTGACFAGFYCKGGAWSPAPHPEEKNPDGISGSAGSLCPIGYYCQEGTQSPQACTEGTSSSIDGGKEPSDCLQCQPGKYCSSSMGTGLCAEGYYCKGGSTTPTPTGGAGGDICPAGHFCPEGSYVAQLCPPGTYSEKGKGECTPCTVGWKCTTSGLQAPEAPCPTGHACVEGTIFPVPCPLGTFAASQGSSSCELCSGGFVCDEAALARPSSICPSGFVCARGARTDLLPLQVFGEDIDDYGLCPVGHFCPPGSATPTPCARGTFQDAVGAVNCKPCSPGYACTEEGLITPRTPCDAGYYCLKGAETSRPTDGLSGGRCPAGWHCPSGSIKPRACSPGQYTSEPGQAKCKPCPAGFECHLLSSTPTACPEGLVCPEGTMKGSHCPYGAYKTLSDSTDLAVACSPCPRGKYCRAGVIAGNCSAGFLCGLGNSVPNPDYSKFSREPYIPTKVQAAGDGIVLTEANWEKVLSKAYGGIPCPSGYYCSEGAEKPSSCNRGSFRLTKGGRWPSDCSLCPAGYYCLPTDALPAVCPKGHYCRRGSQSPAACPQGYYNPKQGQSSSASCLLCPAGMVCPEEGTGELSDDNTCPRGHFCLQGSYKAIPCSPGYHNPQKGSLNSSACQPCPGGVYCGDPGTPDLSVPCPGGHYCSVQSPAAMPCLPGTYCPPGSTNPIPCPGGSFCPMMSAEPQACPQGFFCPEGAKAAFACPAGSMMNPYDVLRSSERTACVPCAEGTYTDSDGSPDCIPCHPGYVCQKGCSSKYPQSLTGDGGVPCMPGHYCPEGSSAMLPCPVGTYNPNSAKGSPDDCLQCPVGSFTNAMGQRSCIACGGSSFTEVGTFECKCMGANRVYQPSSGACICKTGYEHVVSGNDLSGEDSAEPCSPREYPICTGTRVYTHTGSCQETSQVCEDYCGHKGGKYTPETSLCECAGLPDIGEVCDEACRRQQKGISIENGNLVVTNQADSIDLAFALADLSGRSNVLFGSLGCSTSSCPAVLYSVAEDGSTRGYFGVPDSLVDLISEQLNSALDSRRAAISSSPRQPQPMMVRAGTQVPSVESPLLCILIGTSVLWKLEPGTEPVYPVHVHDSLYNTDTVFDAGQFNNLKTEMESGAPLLLFGHTFTNPGIVVFATNRNLNRIVFVKVVNDKAECGSMEPALPHPATKKFTAALSLEFPDIARYGAPDWSTLLITFGIILLVALCLLLLQFPLRTHYWTFAPPLQAENGIDANDEAQPSHPNKFQPSVLCCRGAAAESEAATTFTDLDPRVFQAVYCKLLETMNMLREQLENMGLQQDQLIELGLDMAGPLRTSLFPILAEASEKKAWVEVEDAELGEKLLDMKSMMHLRKGAFEEAVRKASEAMADVDSQTLQQSNVSKLYASLDSQTIEATIRQASAGFIQIAGLNPESFAAALGVEETIATTQALRRLQAVEAATQTMKELTTKLDRQDLKEAEELFATCVSRIKEKLEAGDSWSVSDDVLKTQATLISERIEIWEMRRSIDEAIGRLIDQRNSAFTQQQRSRDDSLLCNLAGFSRAVAALQEDIYSEFCSARKRFEKALSTKRLTALPTIQKQFMEAAESVYKEFVQHQTEAKAGHKVSMDSKTTELSTSIKEMLSQTRKALEETKRDIVNAEQLNWSRREAMEIEMLKAYHSALSQTRQGQLAYQQELERTLIAERAKNECLIRLCVADESAEYIAEECRVATEQQLDAISFEQRSALADLKVAMDSEFSRSLRLARDRLRISRSVALEEQKIATLRHDLKFRTVADELTCLLNAQTKLEENRNQSIKQFHQRLMLELEDYIRKLKVILEIPDSFTVAVELQQCLDALNRNIRAASQSLARSLNLVHDNASNVMLQELRNVRTALLRAEELKEEEIGRRIEVLEEQKRQNIEEDEERRANFNSTVPVEDLEVETEISAAQDKLAVERIRLKFIEDERDALITQISEAKAEALCKGSETELPEVIDSLKKKSLARVEEMNEKVLQLSECQEADNLKSQEKRKDLIMQRICLAREARKKSTLWFERQCRTARDVSRRQHLDMHRLLSQITDKLFSSLIGAMRNIKPTSSLAGEIPAVTHSMTQECAYASVLITISPMMAPPSVSLSERRDLLKASFIQWDETIQAANQDRATYLKDSLQQAQSRRQRLDSAGELVRINIIRAREAEWSTVLLDREAADNSFTLSTMGQSGLWARSYCTSVQDSIRKQTEELEDKQAAELAAFENKLKLSLSEKHQEIQSLRNKLDTLQQRICSMGDQEAEQETVDAVRREAEATQKEITTLEAAADLEAKAADVEKREFVEAQKQELFEHELKQQKEFMEAQWKLSRIAKFEELRSMQLDQSSNAVAQKELLAGCHEAELRDLKALHSRQRILILNQYFHRKQREAKAKFSTLSSSPAVDTQPQGNETDEPSAAEEKATSQEVNDYVKKAMAEKIAQVSAQEEEEIKALKERHYTELAEVVKSNEDAAKAPTTPVKTVQVAWADEQPSTEEATSHGVPQSSDQPRKTLEHTPNKAVAEWQKRMRAGSCASILVTKEDGANLGKHLEQFINTVIRVQREERERQTQIMEEKLAKRNELRVARGKHKRRSTAIKRNKSSGPRKSVMDFKLERLQTARQKEKQMKEQWKAKRGALEGWHPIFWCIVEEEAKQGSYEAYEASANVVARGPTLCNIERVINSLEEGSFLRNMIANLEILVKEFNVLGVPADSLASESEGSESDSSSSSSSSHQTDEPRQRTKASPASSSTSHSSDSSESSDESSDKSSSEGGSSEDSSSEDDSSGGTSSSKSSNTGGEARQDTQPASSTSGVRSGPDQAAPVQRILSSSSGDSMDSKDAQSPQPAMDKSSSASSEASGSSSSDGSEDAGSGTSTSRSSAIMSGTSSRSGSMSNDGTSDDSSAEARSESSSSSSSSSGSNSSSHKNSNSSQSRNTSEDSGNSSSSQQSSTSGAESTSD